MYDLISKNKMSLDLEALEKEIGIKYLAVNNHDNKSVFKIVEAIDKTETTKKEFTLPSVKTTDELRDEFKEIDRIVDKCVTGKTEVKHNPVLLHPVLGLIIFFLIMASIFTSIFYLASWPMDWIDTGFGWLADTTRETMADTWYRGLLVDGIITGLGAVLIFLPQIIILFFAIGYLEDSGYLARAAMLVDKPFSMIGLSGRSFVPLLSGFACSIPAMMAARTIKSRAERLVTIFIIPLMTCSARLPVYIILVTFIAPKDKPFIGGLIMAGLYFFSIILGILTAAVISRFAAFKSKGKGHFRLEIPNMKTPLLSVVLKSTFESSVHYLRKAGPVILVIGISLWFITTFPRSGENEEDRTIASTIGHTIEPGLKPMGLDWRGGVALISGFAAREVFTQSMIIMYGVNEDDADEEEVSKRLIEKMRVVTFEGTSEKIFTPSTIFGLIFFFTMALQCFPTVTVAKSETNSWKIAMTQLVAYTGFAWLGAVIIVQSLRAFGIA
jgi:ferrous iron transport protein B